MSDSRIIVSDVHKCCIKCLSWTAVITGALIGIGLSFLLNLFSLAIGLTAYTTTQEGITTFAVGGFIGLLIGAIVSMFAAGWVAGFLGRPFCSNRCLGALYGFTTWSLALILMVLLTSHIGGFVAYHTNFEASPNQAVVTMNTHHSDIDSSKTETLTNATPAQEESSAHTLGKTAFVTFFLFFAGALASCFGGYYGLLDRKDDKVCGVNKTL